MTKLPKVIVEKASVFTGHRDCVYALAHGNDPHIVFSAAGDGMVVRWDTRKPDLGQLVVQTDNSVYALLSDQKNNHLWVGHNFNGIRLIDLNSNKEEGSAAITTSAIFDIKEYKRRLYVATGDGTLVVMDAGDLTTLAKIKNSEASLRSLALLPEKNWLAAGYSDSMIRIFHLDDLTLIHEWKAHQNSVFTVSFSPDGLYLLSGSRDAHLNIWNTGDLTLSKSIVAHMYAINDVSYSPDAKYFATCSMDKSLKIWDANEFKLLKVIDRARHAGHGTSVNKVLWMPDNRQMVSCSDDRTLSLWDLQFESH